MDESPKGFKPPYMSFATFWNFIADLAARPLPPRIDRSMMSTKSGTDQQNLTAALKALELIDDDQRVSPALTRLAASSEEERQAELAVIVRRFYPKQLGVSEEFGTEQQLKESFTESFGIEGNDTRRKSIAFFLHAARTAGLELSPHFPATRSGSGSPGATKPRRAPAKRRTTNGAAEGGKAPQQTGSPEDGDRYSVQLKSGGRVSIVVGVNLFALSREDRDFVLKLVDQLTGYDQGEPPSTQGGDES